MTKKRILVVCPKGDINSGGILSSFELLKYLKKNDCILRVITSWEGTYNTALSEEQIDNRFVDYNWWAPRDVPKDIAPRVIPAIATIVEEIESFKPDVVITNTSHIPWGALAASYANIPHIWVVREYPINNFEYLSEKIDFIQAYSNKIMANSLELANFYRERYPDKIGHFMSYVDIQEVTLGKGEEYVTLVSPNYISATKNQKDLIDAVAIIKKRRPELKFRVLMMGEKDKAYWPQLEKVIKKSDIGAYVDIRDRVDEPWRLVGRADILVQTSMSESIGRTTTEAMKLGVYTIASDIPGHREAFSLGGGTLYTLGVARELADKIEYALDNPKEIQKIAEAAQKCALKNMSSDASSGAVLKAIKEVSVQRNPMGANTAVYPYLKEFVEDYLQRGRDISRLIKIVEKKNQDTDTLTHAVEEIRNSHAYKLGRLQVKVIKYLPDMISKRRKR